MIQAGFDGLVWQAVKGNLVALNNFLLVDDSAPDSYHFVWIDLESGVPALIPLNPLSLFSFYLPKSFKYRRALFDDVDTSKFKNYINAHKVNLEAQLGSRRYLTILDYIEQLEYHQNRWKLMRRVDRSIQYQFKKGRITESQTNWYVRHPLLWYARELKRVFWRGLSKLFIELPLKIFDKLKALPYKDFFVGLWKILVSRKHRLNTARNYVTARIEHWQSRNQLQPEEAEYLLHYLHNDHANDYLSDFGVHIGMKVFVKGVEYLFFPLLYAAGIINEIVLAFLLISGGPLSRTVYSSYRMTQAAVEGK